MTQVENYPCLFLFDNFADGINVIEPRTFRQWLFKAISAADPTGLLKAELRAGISTTMHFSEFVSAVKFESRSLGRTISHDQDLFKLMLWDASEALSGSAGHKVAHFILDVLRRGRDECFTLSAISNSIQMGMDRFLINCPGYVGAFRIDPGNPILMRSFFASLSHNALFKGGSVVLERSFEDDDNFEFEGARTFAPNGLKWRPHSFGDIPKQFQLPKVVRTERGRLSVDRLRRRTHMTVTGRVFQELLEARWKDANGQVYEFSAAETEQDILKAVMPDGKFTDYLFNRNHKDGAGKAGFIIDELGFDPADWRYLAAQFYDGLLLSEPQNVQINKWEGGYAARFNVLVEITSRTGKKGILRTGWQIKPNELPQLNTAMPGHNSGAVVTPPLPPVLAPVDMPNDDWWQALYTLADEKGCLAHRDVIPTPMLIKDYGIVEEGKCGFAIVKISSGKSDFAKWLVKTGKGQKERKGGPAIACNIASQSIERSKAYALAFARVLALNGIQSSMKTFLT
jgi:hypothetical protein